MTPDLKAIRERCDAATEGPWITRYNGLSVWLKKNRIKTICKHTSPSNISLEDFVGESRSNCDFIAHARTDIPALLDLAEAQATRIEALEEVKNGT